MRSSFVDGDAAWLYPLGVVTFSNNLLFIGRFNATGALNTSYDSETFRLSSMKKPSLEYDLWMEHDIAYWRLVETEDVELAVSAQKGFMSGVLGLGRLHSVEGMFAPMHACVLSLVTSRIHNQALTTVPDRARRQMVSFQTSGALGWACREGEERREEHRLCDSDSAKQGGRAG